MSETLDGDLPFELRTENAVQLSHREPPRDGGVEVQEHAVDEADDEDH